MAWPCALRAQRWRIASVKTFLAAHIHHVHVCTLPHQRLPSHAQPLSFRYKLPFDVWKAQSMRPNTNGRAPGDALRLLPYNLENPFAIGHQNISPAPPQIRRKSRLPVAYCPFHVQLLVGSGLAVGENMDKI